MAERVRATCECGATDCPQRRSVLESEGSAIDRSREWLITMKFAREDERGRLVCPICRTQLRVAVIEDGK